MKFYRWVMALLLLVYYPYSQIHSEQEIRSSSPQYSLSREMGTIIVTYQTDQKGSMLDRIHFWLINEAEERTLYPKKEEYVRTSHTCEERTVVISHLPLGKYRIEFILPSSVPVIETIPSQEVTLGEKSIVKVEQVINLTDEGGKKPVRWFPFSYPWKFAVIYTNWYYPPIVPYRYANLSVTSNLPTRWRILKDDRVVFSGNGSIYNASIRPGYGYLVDAQDVPGYTLSTAPQGYFDVYADQNITVELYYQKDIGYLQIDAGPVPFNEPMHMSISFMPDRERPPLEVTLQPVNGYLGWKSGPLDSGPYLIVYTFPGQSPIAQNILLQKDQILNLVPPIGVGVPLSPPPSPNVNLQPGQILVRTNIPQAIFSLIDSRGERISDSQGLSHTFTRLKPGHYTVEFSSSDKELYIPPAPVSILVEPGATSEAEATYNIKGSLTIRGNLSHFALQFVPQDTTAIPFREEVFNRSKVLQLPEGDYSITPVALPDMPKDVFLPAPELVSIKSTFPQTLFFDFEQKKKGAESKAGMVQPSQTITPTTFLLVPAGVVIVGDPFKDNKQNENPAKEVLLQAFEISTYLVTNLQYADWLNNLLKKQAIKLDPAHPGQVLNLKGDLLLKTLEADPLAQISFHNKIFGVIPGKEKHPVIQVTWEGARQYCEDNGYRLPTEAEWEKAAGMAVTKEGEPLKKYKYGFSRDEISRSWANYKDETKPIHQIRVMTTPVGFYNGDNLLPLATQDREQIRTHDARSPVGAYDMSGNVWEWVAPANPSLSQVEHVVKGGCYDSLAAGVRVSERLLLPQGYSDVFTGFRPARNATPTGSH